MKTTTNSKAILHYLNKSRINLRVVMKVIILAAIVLSVLGTTLAGSYVTTVIKDNNIISGATGYSEIAKTNDANLNYVALTFNGNPYNIVRFCVSASTYSAGRYLNTSSSCGTSYWGNRAVLTLWQPMSRPRFTRGNANVVYTVNWSYISQFTSKPFASGSTTLNMTIR